jgi:ATP synthase protein I
MATLAAMSQEPPSDPLARLGERLDKARASARASNRPAQGNPGNPGLQQGLALGFRIGVELVTAVVVSVAVGWAIDRWLGTRPWVMLVMFFLGVAAGMLNVYRAVTGTGGAVGFRPRPPQPSRAAPPTQKWDDEEC